MSAITTHANAIKLQSLWKHDWEGKMSNQFQATAAKQKCRSVPVIQRETKNLDCTGQFSNFQSLGQFFFVK